MTDKFESLAEAWYWALSPVGNGPVWDPSNPEQALALLVVYAGGIPGEYVPYEDADEFVNELGETVWNTLQGQQAKISTQREHLRDGTQAEIEMMQRSLAEHQAIRLIITELQMALDQGDERISIAAVLRDLKKAINYRTPPKDSRRA